MGIMTDSGLAWMFLEAKHEQRDLFELLVRDKYPVRGSRRMDRGRDRERRGVNLRMSLLGGMMLGVAVCSNAGTSV